MSNKRIRGIAIHRSILVGSTATPLTPAEKLTAPPDHSHKWTVAVRSAASHPLPSLPSIAGLPPNAPFTPGSESSALALATSNSVSTSPQAPPTSNAAALTPTTPSAASIATRGRDQETDYHKMVGGKDDISHFIKRVQFKLHDTYAQPTRNIDKPPYSVTETGWGEFEIQVKIFFIPEANEKPVTLFHHLKLHPWLNNPSIVNNAVTLANPAAPSEGQLKPTATEDVAMSSAEQEPASKSDHGQATTSSAADQVPAETSVQPAPAPILPPVVHSWQYDEIVFPEPTEAFYEILTSKASTPLPTSSAQSFTDPSAYRTYLSALDTANGVSTRSAQQHVGPPHPLHAPTGYLFDALSQEAQLAESERLDLARISAVRELEKGREKLIKAEKALKETRNKIAAAAAANSGPPINAANP
ncbi:protein AF-9 [Violaceomyces palustris]|uniref:Protein AF-9 n=1 Tax=Violaceomyces palustris TaxID=1673888 RepID=A0ACD0NSX8_9BASI|nr:protein AF-9 [Violaceomyces palustris]